ncbi:MAG: serine hydrolase, partial [Acidithiobacillales bacterium]
LPLTALLLAVLLVSTASAPSPAAGPAVSPKDPLAGWDEFVNRAIGEWKVPGLAMAIVRGDDVLLLKGYGLRDVERRLPVTPGTLFAIVSATKAFTTFVLATLVDEGKLDWDTPVGQYIPGFRMWDPMASERMNAVDLVTHRSGLPRHDALWYNATLSRKELVERLRWLEPSKDFRTDFQYNNLMFLTAGYLAERITGRTWEEAVRARIFEPLGMTESNFSVAAAQKSPDVALPYRERDEKILPMDFRDITDMGPAGSINSSARDLVPWLKVHVNGGRLGEKAVISPATMAFLHTPQMETGVKQTEPEVVPGGYALGWFTDIYRGVQRVHHGGNIDGFSALVMLVPSERLGLAILSNKNASPLPGILARHAIDRLCGFPPRDWNAEGLAKRVKGREFEKEGEAKKGTVRKPGTHPAHPLAEYAGEYEHPAYGILEISVKGSGLEMTYNRITTPMEHWHYEVWSGLRVEGEKADNTFENFRIEFLTDFDGEVSGVAAPMEPTVKDIVFTRRPDAQLSDPAFLARLAGAYEMGPQTAVFTVQGSVLVLEVDGRRQPDLLPYRNGRFVLKGASGYSVRFTLGATGHASEAVFVQPDGVFTAKRKD